MLKIKDIKEEKNTLLIEYEWEGNPERMRVPKDRDWSEEINGVTALENLLIEYEQSRNKISRYKLKKLKNKVIHK